jgi:hypothetical protein
MSVLWEVRCFRRMSANALTSSIWSPPDPFNGVLCLWTCFVCRPFDICLLPDHAEGCQRNMMQGGASVDFFGDASTNVRSIQRRSHLHTHCLVVSCFLPSITHAGSRIALWCPLRCGVWWNALRVVRFAELVCWSANNKFTCKRAKNQTKTHSGGRVSKQMIFSSSTNAAASFIALVLPPWLHRAS